jgi:hypothetical protein
MQAHGFRFEIMVKNREEPLSAVGGGQELGGLGLILTRRARISG